MKEEVERKRNMNTRMKRKHEYEMNERELTYLFVYSLL